MMYKHFLYYYLYYFKIFIIIINKHLYFIILNKLYFALTKLCLFFATFPPPNSHYCTAKQIELVHTLTVNILIIIIIIQL